eukprot:scaffold15046_cov72-Phaeocystis_antarctica.AAC.1
MSASVTLPSSRCPRHRACAPLMRAHPAPHSKVTRARLPTGTSQEHPPVECVLALARLCRARAQLKGKGVELGDGTARHEEVVAVLHLDAQHAAHLVRTAHEVPQPAACLLAQRGVEIAEQRRAVEHLGLVHRHVRRARLRVEVLPVRVELSQHALEHRVALGAERGGEVVHLAHPAHEPHGGAEHGVELDRAVHLGPQHHGHLQRLLHQPRLQCRAALSTAAFPAASLRGARRCHRRRPLPPLLLACGDARLRGAQHPLRSH